MKKDSEKPNYVSVYMKDIHSYYSFLDWIENNFGKDTAKRKDVAALMIVLLKKITEDAIKNLRIEEKNLFVEASEKLEKRLRSKYVKEESK